MIALLKIEIPRFKITLNEKRNLKKALREAANMVAREARSLTRNAVGAGRFYNIGHEGHRASAPGQPPASLTGALSRSISTKVGRDGQSISIRDNQFYAKFLEVGAQGGSGNRVKGGKGKRNAKARKNQPKPTPSSRRVLEPRPFLSRALDDHRAEIEEKIIAAVNADLEFGK